MNKKGFTLIELLVVIAIIGILASVVLTQVNSARNKTLDVAVKSDLDAIRATATVLYDTIGNKYSNTGAVISGDCTALAALTAGGTAIAAAGAVPASIFLDNNINQALNHIKKSNSNVVPVCYIPADGSNFTIIAKLKTSAYACLDGNGQLKTTTGNTTTAYNATVGTDGTPAGSVYALLTAADVDCN